MSLRDGNFFELDPGGSRYPLASEGLDIFDRVLGGIGEELANQAQTLVVRNMGGGFSLERLAVEILPVVLVYPTMSHHVWRRLTWEKKVSMTEGVTSAATPRVLKTMADPFD
jgi:hypothetical protein